MRLPSKENKLNLLLVYIYIFYFCLTLWILLPQYGITKVRQTMEAVMAPAAQGSAILGDPERYWGAENIWQNFGPFLYQNDLLSQGGRKA